MANIVPVIKTALKVVTASAAVLKALDDNPRISEKAGDVLAKAKEAAASRSPKRRFEAKMTAIEACAEAAESEFGETERAEQWRKQASALRVRAELMWNAASGKQRRQQMRQINSETTALLDQINQQLMTLSQDRSSATPPLDGPDEDPAQRSLARDDQLTLLGEAIEPADSPS